MMKNLLNQPSIGGLNEFAGFGKRFDETRARWNEEIETKKLQVEQLKDALDKHTAGFNFAGLHAGFHDLWLAKKSELRFLNVTLCILAALIPAAVVSGPFFIEPHLSIEIKGIDRIFLTYQHCP
jgi:hypothetical protein